MIDNFSKFCWTVPLENKNAQATKVTFEKIPLGSKISPNLIETNRVKEIFSKIFTYFSNRNNIKRYSRYSSLGAVFPERLNRTIRDLPKKAVFERGDTIWNVVLPTLRKQYNIRIQTSTKLTPIQASLKKNERYVY